MLIIISLILSAPMLSSNKCNKENISKDANGTLWIRKTRQKTNIMCNIPLLNIPKQILDKYEEHPECVKKNILLPIPSNQKMNSYLKEITDIC